MKKYLLIAGIAVAFVACKNDKEVTTDTNKEVVTEEVETSKKKATPANITAVINAHGGLAQWERMNNICFTFNGKGGEEVHTTSLKNRKAKVEHEDWTIGNDGKNTWLLENKARSYEGNAAFYNNLMFYFYAMPFVLADDGIVYTNMPQKKLNGNMYNAVKIGYESGVGYSPKDEYMLFTNPKTNQMEWLGYTVTGRTQEKSDTWKFIKYDKWQEVNGLQLPEKMTWYNVENNEPKDERNDVVFRKVTITETQLEDGVFAMPQGAKVAE